MIRIKDGQYLAIINEKRMVEVHADSLEEAKNIANSMFDGDMRVCKIPPIIGYITK